MSQTSQKQKGDEDPKKVNRQLRRRNHSLGPENRDSAAAEGKNKRKDCLDRLDQLSPERKPLSPRPTIVRPIPLLPKPLSPTRKPLSPRVLISPVKNAESQKKTHQQSITPTSSPSLMPLSPGILPSATNFFYEEPVAVKEELTEEHLKLLYLMSLYTGRTKEGKERYIRQLPLLVLLYEGIVEGEFDYDYAPSSEVINSQRTHLNLTQEGKDDIDDLRELELVNGLKLTSGGFQAVTAFQINKKGREKLEEVSQESRLSVLNLVHAASAKKKRETDPKGKKEEEEEEEFDLENVEYEDLLEVQWDEDEKNFFLKNDRYSVSFISSITDCEDVSYVSSPYLPECVRHGGRMMVSNAKRALEATKGVNNIRDELEELITLSHIRLIVGEWIPFGANNIVLLNQKLGATERIKGGLYTGVTHSEPSSALFEVEAGMTSVQILDFEHTSYLNFEAEVYYPEDEGILQVEHFGVHVRDNGSVLYGMMIESIEKNLKDKISIDLLSRLLVDVHQDSSRIMDSVLSKYQRSLLEILFLQNSESRDKYNLLFAEDIDPWQDAIKFMDKEGFECELKQVLGETQSAHNLSQNEMIFMGTHGTLLVGPNSHRHAPIMIAFLTLECQSVFIYNYVLRIFVLSDKLQQIEQQIDGHQKNPNSISTIRSELSAVSKDLSHLSEVREYMEEALMDTDFCELQPEKNDEAAMSLWDLLEIEARVQRQLRRVQDLKKNLDALQHDLHSCRDSTDVISETQMFRVQEALQSNTKNLEDVFRAGERTSSSLEILQVVLSGTLAFEILDRITGEWSVIETEWAQAWIAQPILEKPGLWFLINICMWMVIAFALTKFMNYLTSGTGVISCRYKANLPVDFDRLNEWLETKDIQEEELIQENLEGGLVVKKVSWQEEDPSPKGIWYKINPQVEVTYNPAHSYLLGVFLTVQRYSLPPSFDDKKLGEIFFEELLSAKVISEYPEHLHLAREKD